MEDFFNQNVLMNVVLCFVYRRGEESEVVHVFRAISLNTKQVRTETSVCCYGHTSTFQLVVFIGVIESPFFFCVSYKTSSLNWGLLCQHKALQSYYLIIWPFITRINTHCFPCVKPCRQCVSSASEAVRVIKTKQEI